MNGRSWIPLVLLLLILGGLAREPRAGGNQATPAPSDSPVAVVSPSPDGSPTPAPTESATPSESPAPTATPSSTPSSDPDSALAVLAALVSADEVRDGYNRDLFRHWIDADGDGCDTRREVLIAESTSTVTVGASCALGGGAWSSAYDSLLFSDPAKLDIDHFVPLAEAWDSGAYAWDAARRERFANDLGDARSLIAVSAASNRSKSDQDPAEWLPPEEGYRCTYASTWIAVKARWGLAVDGVERAALESLLGGCPDGPLSVIPAE
jgi:hypothetical protein